MQVYEKNKITTEENSSLSKESSLPSADSIIIPRNSIPLPFLLIYDKQIKIEQIEAYVHQSCPSISNLSLHPSFIPLSQRWNFEQPRFRAGEIKKLGKQFSRWTVTKHEISSFGI